MPRVVAAWGMVVGLGLAALVALPAHLPAQEKMAGPVTPPETEEEKKEREVRRQCAVVLCATLHNRKPAEGQATCSIQKTWRKEVVTKILARGKVSWPWGDTRCSAEIKLDRSVLVKAMQEAEFEAQFDTHDIRCQIESAKDTKDKYDVKAQIRPKIAFKQGKAVKASLNWGKIEAPTLTKTALWSITAVDNTFGLLQSITVEDINEFIGTKCMEVKEEWQGK